MKKILTLCMIFLLMPSLFGFTAHAYQYEPVQAGIEVEITLGGTAVIIPNVNSPIPEKTEITLKDGEAGRFTIDFTEIGEYHYTVKTVPDDRNLNFDKTVYNLTVYVSEEDGTLTSAVIALAEGKGSEKQQRLVFVNTASEEPKTTAAPPDDKTDPPSDKNRNPKTEDDTRMETYFLLAMLASAGLLALSVIYLIDTRKMLGSGKKKNHQ